jgi:2-polyprenyl-3-methyl-5-hydroxy-6-metoxy-1,4-benzoquinol methylase
VKDYVENAELEEYDCIILQNILEHVKDPAKVLSKLKKHLKTNGRMYISIPLANSFHRYLGVMEGIINDVKELAPSDHEYGHYSVYTPELFREHVAKAGLKIAHFVPFYLKPLPTGTLQSLSLDAHRQLFKLGEKFPEYAAYLYAEIE